MSMFYDNRVNQIREKRRVMNKIRQQLEELEEQGEVDVDIESPSIYLSLKVAELVMQNKENFVLRVIGLATQMLKWLRGQVMFLQRSISDKTSIHCRRLVAKARTDCIRTSRGAAQAVGYTVSGNQRLK